MKGFACEGKCQQEKMKGPPKKSEGVSESRRVRAGATKRARRQSNRVLAGTGDTESRMGLSLGGRAKEAKWPAGAVMVEHQATDRRETPGAAERQSD